MLHMVTFMSDMHPPHVQAELMYSLPANKPSTLVTASHSIVRLLTHIKLNLLLVCCRNDIFGARDAGCFAWLWGMDVVTFDEVSRKMLHEAEQDDPDSDAILSPIS